MLQTAEPVEIYLLPGDLHFGDKNTRIRTVLGSCVSIAVWHPLLHIGGMGHYMLPSRGKPGNHNLNGLYGDESIELLLREIGKRNTRPADYQVKLFGGGNMFRRHFAEGVFNVAGSNIDAARELLAASGFNIHAEHVGGSGHRSIIFDLHDGSVLVKHEKNMGCLNVSQRTQTGQKIISTYDKNKSANRGRFGCSASGATGCA